MKKTIALLLAVLCVFALFCGCSKSSEQTNSATADEVTTQAPATTEPEFSAEEIVQIYMDNMSVWEYVPVSSEAYRYLFLDLDFDGILELITTTMQGSAQASDNKFYRVDTETKTVSEIPFPDKNPNQQWDFEGGDYPQIYRNNETGELKYMVYDHERAAAMAAGMHIGELTLDSDGNISSKNLWATSYIGAESPLSETGEDSYSFSIYDENSNAKEVSEEEYTNYVADYENKNTHMELDFYVVESANVEYTFTELTKEEQAEKLLMSYTVFSYK